MFLPCKPGSAIAAIGKLLCMFPQLNSITSMFENNVILCKRHFEKVLKMFLQIYVDTNVETKLGVLSDIRHSQEAHKILLHVGMKTSFLMVMPLRF